MVLTEAPYLNVNIQILRKEWETFLFDVTTNRIIFGILVLGCLLQVYRNNNKFLQIDLLSCNLTHFITSHVDSLYKIISPTNRHVLLLSFQSDAFYFFLLTNCLD